jgi:hypothetical protein
MGKPDVYRRLLERQAGSAGDALLPAGTPSPLPKRTRLWRSLAPPPPKRMATIWRGVPTTS